MGVIAEFYSQMKADYRIQASVVVIAVGTTYLLWRRRSQEEYNLPPGPTPLPILGNLLDLRKDAKTFLTFTEMAKKYGPIFSIKVGSLDFILLNTIEAVRDTFVKRQNDYAGRPTFYSIDQLPSFKAGIVFGDFNPVWALERKLAHSAIRKYASGHHLEKLVQFSMDKAGALLREQKEPFDPLDILSLLVYNIIASMCFGTRFELDDPFFKEIIRVNMEVTEAFGNGLLPDFLPFLGPIYDVFPTKGLRMIRELDVMWQKFLKDSYQEHEKNFDPDNVTDLTYHIIANMKEAEKDEEHRSTLSQLTEENIRGTISDMFFAGTDTSRFTLQWVLGYAAKFPEIQRKIREEVDEIVDPTEYILLSHLPQLPYSMAVIYEVLRIRPIVAMSLPHKTLCDTKAFGYDIPAGKQVAANMWALHMNPEEWDEPERFQPERFLDEYGQLAPKPNSYLPFSTGRRTCVGEALAKVELHLLTATLFQRFFFEPPPGEPFTLEMMDLGFGCIAKPFKLLVKPRN